MRYSSLTMRTATVANLRNEFPKVFAWIEAGEDIAITRRGSAMNVDYNIK